MALTDNLISFWKLDETSGNAIDAHGSNTLTAVASPGTAAGKIETARTFNGSSQYFSVASNASVQVGDEDFYVAGWVYLNSVTAVNRIVVGKYNTNTGQHRQWLLFFRGPTQRFAFIGSANGSTVAIGIKFIRDSQCIHVVFCRGLARCSKQLSRNFSKWHSRYRKLCVWDL
jgi:hypothetical protein